MAKLVKANEKIANALLTQFSDNRSYLLKIYQHRKLSEFLHNFRQYIQIRTFRSLRS